MSETTNTEALRASLKALIDQGLTFGDAVAVFAQEPVSAMADRCLGEISDHHRDGDLEFDDAPVVSEGDDNGCYVMCWKWIEDPDPSADEEDEESE